MRMVSLLFGLAAVIAASALDVDYFQPLQQGRPHRHPHFLGASRPSAPNLPPGMTEQSLSARPWGHENYDVEGLRKERGELFDQLGEQRLIVEAGGDNPVPAAQPPMLPPPEDYSVSNSAAVNPIDDDPSLPVDPLGLKRKHAEEEAQRTGLSPVPEPLGAPVMQITLPAPQLSAQFDPPHQQQPQQQQAPPLPTQFAPGQAQLGLGSPRQLPLAAPAMPYTMTRRAPTPSTFSSQPPQGQQSPVYVSAPSLEQAPTPQRIDRLFGTQGLVSTGMQSGYRSAGGYGYGAQNYAQQDFQQPQFNYPNPLQMQMQATYGPSVMNPAMGLGFGMPSVPWLGGSSSMGSALPPKYPDPPQIRTGFPLMNAYGYAPAPRREDFGALPTYPPRLPSSGAMDFEQRSGVF